MSGQRHEGGWLGLALLLAASGCGTQDFTVESDLPAQTVQGDALGGLLGSVFPSAFTVSIDLKAEEQKRDTGPASHVYLKSISLAITPHDAPAGNFDFLDEIHLFAAPMAAPDQKVEIASKVPVPKGAASLTLDVVPNVDLISDVQGGTEITATAKGRAPSQSTSIDGHVVIDVKI